MCVDAFSHIDRSISLINPQNMNTAERKAERFLDVLLSKQLLDT